jgi:hypothetical protein
MLLFWSLFFAVAVPVGLPDRAQQMVETLLQAREDPSKPVLLIGDVRLAGRLRVLLGKEWTLVQSDQPDFSVAANFDTILLPDRDVPQFLSRGYQIQRAALSLGMPTRGELWPALKSRR